MGVVIEGEVTDCKVFVGRGRGKSQRDSSEASLV